MHLILEHLNIKQILTDIREEIVSNTIILITIYINGQITHIENQWGNSGLKWHIDQLDITDICKTFHPQKAKHTFSSSVHETFSRIDHMLGHRTSFNNFQFSSVQSLSCVRLFVTPWITACQASLSITNPWSSLKLLSIESVMPSSHLILCRPLLLLLPTTLRG